MSSPRTYRLEPLDTSGVFLGLGMVQCGLIGGAVTLAVAAISAGVPLLAAALPPAIGVSLCFGRIGGRPAWEWLPVAGGWLYRRLAWGQVVRSAPAVAARPRRAGAPAAVPGRAQPSRCPVARRQRAGVCA
jgi:hypothetical protein